METCLLSMLVSCRETFSSCFSCYSETFVKWVQIDYSLFEQLQEQTPLFFSQIPVMN